METGPCLCLDMGPKTILRLFRHGRIWSQSEKLLVVSEAVAPGASILRGRAPAPPVFEPALQLDQALQG